MSWGKLEDTFRDHWKPKRLAVELGVSRAEARGLLVGLWSWAISHAPDGDLSQLTEKEIEEAADWTGDPGAFVRASTREHVGLLDRTNHGYAIHEFFERSETRKATVRKARQRERSRVNAPTIYVIERGDGPVKIGFTTDLKRRLFEYEQGRSRLITSFSGTQAEEQALHARFGRWRLGKSEWFERSKEINQWIQALMPVSRDTNKTSHAGEERRREEKRGEEIASEPARAPEMTHIGSRHPEVQFFEARYHELFAGSLAFDDKARARAAEVIRLCAENNKRWQDVLDAFADERWSFANGSLDWLRDKLGEVVNWIAKGRPRRTTGPTSGPSRGSVTDSHTKAAQTASDEMRRRHEHDRQKAASPETAKTTIAGILDKLGTQKQPPPNAAETAALPQEKP